SQVQQRSHDAGIDTTGESQQNLAGTNLRAHATYRILDDVAHAPQRIAGADLTHETLEQACTLQGMRHLRMKLHAVVTAPLIAHRRVWRILGGSRDDKAM